jgi:hypothetical protein
METAGTVCAYCGKPIEPKATGRPARYCDAKCRVSAHRERRTADDAATRLPDLDRRLENAYDTLVKAAGELVDVARFDRGSLAPSLLVASVAAHTALADLATAARELDDARGVLARHGIHVPSQAAPVTVAVARVGGGANAAVVS